MLTCSPDDVVNDLLRNRLVTEETNGPPSIHELVEIPRPFLHLHRAECQLSVRHMGGVLKDIHAHIIRLLEQQSRAASPETWCVWILVSGAAPLTTQPQNISEHSC